MPATPVRDIELIEVGSLGKEVLSNDAFTNLSHGISGAATIPLAATDHTLTTTNDGEAMRFVLILVGVLTANVNVIVPTESRVYIVDNRTTGAFTVTFRPAAGGGVAVDQSARTLIYCDSSNVYPVASGTGGGGGSGAPTDASYLVGASHTLLSGERVVTNTPTISWDLTTAGQAKAIIPPDAVTYSHIQNVTAGRLLGRDTASAGDVQEITLGTGLAMSAGGVLSATGGGGGQPLDATLTALAGVTTAADTIEYFTAVDVAASTPLTPLARTLLDDTTQAAMQATLALVPGTDVQAQDATLTAIAGVTTGADTLQFFTGVDTASTTPFSPLARSLLDDTTQAAMQATLGVTAGGGAPTDAEYVTSTASAGLSVERVLADSATVTWDRSVAGQITATAIGGATYTDEQAQDAVGAMLVDTATIDLTYGDGGPTLQADVKDLSITEAKLTFVDVTTKDATTSVHGLLRKLSGTATQYLDGSGDWTTPAGGTNYWSRTAEIVTLATAFTAWWKLEEASSTRVDAVAGLSMTPVGGANLTQVAGRIGNAVGMNGTAGTYLTMTNTAAVQMSTTTSLTVMAWVYLTSLTACAYISKGNAGANASYEYLLQLHTTNKFRFAIANGTTSQNLDDTGPSPTLNTWHLVLGWYDQASGTVNLQVDNGIVISAAATTTSWASTHPCEIGRLAGWSGSPSLNGRVDMVGIAKRVLTTTERSQLWNGGAGLDHPFGTAAGFYVAPLTTADSLLLGATRTTNERLEVDGAVKVGNSTGTVDGIVRWTGTDMEARKGGAWVSMTGAGASAYTDEQAQDAVGTILVDSATIDLTYTDATPALTAAIVAGSVGTTQLTNDGVTYAKLQNVTDARLLGRSAGSAGDAQEITVGAGLSLSAGALTSTGQPLDATLTALAGLATGADQLPYATGTDTFAQTPLTALARTLLDDTSQAAMQTTLGLVPGTHVQAQDAELQALAGLTSAADRLPYFTGLGTAALATFTTAGRNLVDDADTTAQRTTLGLGTMAQQDAAAVTITGGTAALGAVGLGGIVPGAYGDPLDILYDHMTQFGIGIRPTTESGGGAALNFSNSSGAQVGTIQTTASATSYNTTSDVRLKHAIAPLTGALDVVRGLRPITHLWNADDSRGYGFLAHELQQVIPDAVTGIPDDVNEDGSVKPQQVDHSKLVPWLTAALQDTLAQVQALTARVVSLEEQLGV